MDMKITKEIPAFRTSKLGNDKRCVIVQFPNCISTKTGMPFKWLPTYKQIMEIRIALEEIENESWRRGGEDD